MLPPPLYCAILDWGRPCGDRGIGSGKRGREGTMENSYGIGVENKYSIFLEDDGDPFETLENVKKEKEEKKAKVPGKENKSAKVPTDKGNKKTPAKENVTKTDQRHGMISNPYLALQQSSPVTLF